MIKKSTVKKTSASSKKKPAKKTTKKLSSKTTTTRKKPECAAKAVALKVGQKAPSLTLLTDEGKKVSLSDFKGKRVVLYFYPKDDTPGCTIEACAFRDGISEIEETGAVVLGVSPDSVESHRKFSQKYELNFPLLSDTEKKGVQSYGVWKEKSLYGRKYMGVERTTFIIDEQGKIREIFPKVKVDGHLEEVLGELDLMSS